MCFQQFWRIELCENQYRETLYSDELIFKKVYIQDETFMDLNRYKVGSSGESLIENPPKDRGMSLQAFPGVCIK